MASQPRGNVIIDQEECKGCGLCVDSCPPECLELAPGLNKYGVHPAEYTGEDCTGCGACYYCCPEPGAITVERVAPPPKTAAAEGHGPSASSGQTSGRAAVEGHGFSRAATGQENVGFSPGAEKEEVANAAAL